MEGVIEYTTEVIASSYCRDCTSKRNVESRRKRTLIARLAKVSKSAEPDAVPATDWPGTCEVCGDETRNIVIVDSPRLGFCCWRCEKLIGEGQERLVKMLRLLLEHLVREQELVDASLIGPQWPKPHQRPVHKGNKLGKFEHHEECLDLEARVRVALLWLLRSRATEPAGA